MRFELALAVGIIFFCCWCAYIIIRMNSSLSPQQDSTANTSTNPTTPTSSNLLEARQLRDQHHHYFASRYQQQQQPPAQQQQLYDQQLRTPLTSANYPAYTALSPTRSGESFQPDYASARASPPEVLVAPDTGSQPSGQEEEGEEGEGEGEDEDQPEDGGGQVRRESEEIEAGRSFSQNDADSTERDSQGNPIRAYRRHLINGKPVSSPSSTTATITRGDFDKVVNEIESDNQDDGQGEEYDDQSAEEQPAVPQRSQQPESSESRLSLSQLTKPTSRFERKLKEVDSRKPSERMKRQKAKSSRLEEIDEHSKDNLLPAKVRDSHQHRLRESLRAQQWDDDATSANPAGANSATDDDLQQHRGQEEEEEDQEGAVNNQQQGAKESPASQEDEVQDRADIEFKDLDLLSDGSFPFLDGGSEQKEEPEEGRVRVARSIGDVAEAANNSTAGSQGDSAGEYGEVGLSADNELSSTNGNFSRLSTEAAASSNTKELSSQEDLAIEVLANPPTLVSGLDNSSATTANYLLSNGHSGGPQQQTTAIDTSAPAYGAYPVSGAPQVGQFDAANGGQVASQSHQKKKVKKKKKKKKKKSAHVKRAQKQHTKYDAAKAASMKRKSKLKKGGAAEKKLKKGQKYAKSYKEFKGSTRGKKGARGMGNKGAKKGALYYKDQGYKKRGFKKNYQKVESGDHKTYFDEFRDKDHSKKWKDFKDKHHYSHGKQWAANDRKKYKNMSAKELRDKKYGLGKWREKEQSKYRKNYSKKTNANSLEQSKKVKKKVKKKGQKSKHYHY